MYNYDILMIVWQIQTMNVSQKKIANSINYVSVSEIEIVVNVHFLKIHAWLSGVHWQNLPVLRSASF